MAEVHFTEDAIADLQALDGSVVRRVLKKVAILRTNPEAGQPLGSRRISNLTGFRKLLVSNRQYRVVYRVDEDGSVCVIWVIASRVDDECYDIASKRLREHGGDNPTTLDIADMIDRLKPPN